MTVSTAQQTALEQPAVRAIFFLELDFASATQYLCSAGQTLTWGGHDWVGVGALGAISPVEESDGLDSKGMNFTLSVAESSWLSVAMGNVEDYRNRDAKLYMCPLNEAFQLIDTPVQCWRGTMDPMSPSADAEGKGQITLKCETSANGLKRRPSLRINPAQQKQRYHADTGLDYLPDLIANPTVWLSKRFQQQP